MTPNLQVVYNYIKTLPEWSYVDRVGICNCRRIADSQTYSQHSWCNALDIHFTPSVGTPATGAALAAGTRMREKILVEFEPHIYEMIWQAPSHWEHIHVSTWPKGWLLPPCAGGTQRVKYEDGTVVAEDFPLTINDGDDDMPLTPEDIEAIATRTAEKVAFLPVPDEDDNAGTRGAVHAWRQAWGASLDAVAAIAVLQKQVAALQLAVDPDAIAEAVVAKLAAELAD